MSEIDDKLLIEQSHTRLKLLFKILNITYILILCEHVCFDLFLHPVYPVSTMVYQLFLYTNIDN